MRVHLLVQDVNRARLWQKHLIALNSFGEDPEVAARNDREEMEAAAAEKSEQAYGDDAFDDEFEEEDEDGEAAGSEEGYSEDDFDEEEVAADTAAERAKKRLAGPTFHLSATVTEAKGLPNSRFDKNDVYVSCCLSTYYDEVVKGEESEDDRRSRHRTTTHKDGGATPSWGGKGGGGAFLDRGETLVWTLENPGTELIVEVWDEDYGVDGDDLIGKAAIPLDPSGEFVSGNEDGDWYALKGANGLGVGQIRLGLNCTREAGEAAGVGWAKMNAVRTRVKIAGYTGITQAKAHNEANKRRREAAATAVKIELDRAKAARDEKEQVIEEALREAAAGTKVDPWGKKDGHPSFYQPPPRTYYASAGFVREARNNAQGSEQHEGGGSATGAHIRYASGELRLMLEANLDAQIGRGADMWNSPNVATSSKDQRINRIIRGLVRIPDPYPEDV
jgi:hypothetical protein